MQLYGNGHIHNVVSMLVNQVNIVKLNVENDDFVLTLSNVVNRNVKTDHVDSTLFNVVSFNIDVLQNIFSKLIWRFRTSRRHINLTTIYIRSNYNKVGCIETGCIIFGHFAHVNHAFLINDDGVLSSLFNL